jgi:hypothetical protein
VTVQLRKRPSSPGNGRLNGAEGLTAGLVRSLLGAVTEKSAAISGSSSALDHGNATTALAAAAELDLVSLPDALEIVLVLVNEPGKFRRVGPGGTPVYCGELPDVGFERRTLCSHAWSAWWDGNRKPRHVRWPSSFTGAGSSGRGKN